MKDKLQKLKQQHQSEMDKYNGQIDEHIDTHGVKYTSPIKNLRAASNYHRGAVNALIELERIL